MAVVKFGSCSLSCVATSLSSAYPRKKSFRPNVSLGLFDIRQRDVLKRGIDKITNCHVVRGIFKLKGRFPAKQNICFASSDYQSQFGEPSIAPEEENQGPHIEDISSASEAYVRFEGNDGKPGLVSFYSRPYKMEDKKVISNPQRSGSNLVWFVGPAVLVASFIFPSIYLRKILSTVFEDSLLTDFLILFFTEAIFYCGVAMFLFLIDRQRRPVKLNPIAMDNRSLAPQLGYRISSVAVLVLSLIIPMVTMGLVRPWTGPTASATLAPYLVGIVVQFAFEQYAARKKSPSWPVIPIIFHVYRLHQLNRAAQLVTALSLTVRGAEITPHRLAITSSLGTLSNVLHCLGVICIWSLSSFLMRFFPSTTMNTQ